MAAAVTVFEEAETVAEVAAVAVAAAVVSGSSSNSPRRLRRSAGQVQKLLHRCPLLHLPTLSVAQ